MNRVYIISNSSSDAVWDGKDIHPHRPHHGVCRQIRRAEIPRGKSVRIRQSGLHPSDDPMAHVPGGRIPDLVRTDYLPFPDAARMRRCVHRLRRHYVRGGRGAVRDRHDSGFQGGPGGKTLDRPGGCSSLRNGVGHPRVGDARHPDFRLRRRNPDLRPRRCGDPHGHRRLLRPTS